MILEWPHLCCEAIIRPKTLPICGEDLFLFWFPSALGPKTPLIYGEDLFFYVSICIYAFGLNFHLSRSRLRKRHMAKGDTTKPRSGCPCKIPHRVPPFLATPLACCFELLRIKRQYDIYYCHRAVVIHFNHLVQIPSTVTSWMSAPIFLRRKENYLIVKPLVRYCIGTNMQ